MVAPEFRRRTDPDHQSLPAGHLQVLSVPANNSNACFYRGISNAGLNASRRVNRTPVKCHSGANARVAFTGDIARAMTAVGAQGSAAAAPHQFAGISRAELLHDI